MERIEYILEKGLDVRICNLLRGGVGVEVYPLLDCKLRITDKRQFEGLDLADALTQAHNFVKCISRKD